MEAKGEEMTEEFKPCPFCGESEIYLNWDHCNKKGTVYFMSCHTCGASSPWIHFEEYSNEQEKEIICIKKWNERVLH